jgi:DNA-binding protein H-NS
MATTLAQVNKQIEKLQREAQALKAKQTKGVIARLREAIDQYQLTAADLGFEKAPASAEKIKPAAKPTSKKPGRRVSRRKATGVIKFRDSEGHTWTGHGRAPNWFNSALKSGKTREELEVKAS